MSHTNSTANYNLPQFVGSDTPAWLTDVNGAMSAIDSQMKTNADSASTANASATTANGNIGTLSNLNTTAKTDLVSAVNEVNTGLGTVSGVASSASNTATQASDKINSLSDYLNLSRFGDCQVTGNGITSLNVGSCHYATNEDGTVGKLYGWISFSCNNANGFTISIQTPFRPSTDINVQGCAVITRQGTAFEAVSDVTYEIKTDGTVTISKGSAWYNKTITLIPLASLIFFKDFGDTSTEN